MIIILPLLATCFTLADFFNPSKIDYCNLKCRDGQVSSGCANQKCFKQKDKYEIALRDIVSFRNEILDTHNRLRNRIAKGEELRNNNYPPAADMHVLNYDLELEHLARCYVLGEFTRDPDKKCTMSSFCDPVYAPGQNVYGSSANDLSMSAVEQGITTWYDELTEIPKIHRQDLVKRFTSALKHHAGHFTQLIWGPTTRIGCVRVWYPTNPYDMYRYILACNYAAADEMCAGNVIGRAIYTVGRGCSQCGIAKCNNVTGGIYDGLCGKTKPVPLNLPATINEKRKNDDNKNNYNNKDDNKKKKKKKLLKKGEGSNNKSNELLFLSVILLITDYLAGVNH